MFTLDELKAAQDEIRQKQEELAEQSRKIGKDLFRKGADDIFKSFPEAKAFAWTQYTPYFNDGDECLFSVNTYNTCVFETEDISEEWVQARNDDLGYAFELYGRTDGYGKDSDYFKKYYGNIPEWKLAAGVAVNGLIQAIPEGTMRDMFGDHIKVIVTPDDILVEDFAHD